MTTTTLVLIIIAAAVVLLVALGTMYVKAPPSYAYILSGIKRVPRVMIGTGGFKSLSSSASTACTSDR